jgi:hypothetical protein
MSTAETLFFRCIPRLVTHDLDLHPYSRLLFVMIAEEAYLDTGIVQMTIEYLAKISGMSVKTVMRYLPPLEAKGYLRVTRALKGSKIPNIYQIIGAAAEVVVRKGKTVAERAAEPSTSFRQGTERPSMPNRGEQGQSSSLNAQRPVGDSSAFNHPIDTPDGASVPPTAAPQTPDQVPDRPLTKQQEKQRNTYEVLNVVDNADTTPIFKLEDVHPRIMQGWIDQYGITRVWEVLQALARQKHVANKGGWVREALEKNWQFGRNAHKNVYNDPQRYITGEYADYINH